MIGFEARLYKQGEWVLLRLPSAASKQLPSRGQVMVRGTINGARFEKVLEPDGDWGHWCKVDASLQTELGVREGDTVTLHVEASKNWPEPHIPADFSHALTSAPDSVQDLWKQITPMARWEWIRWVNTTSVSETRGRRIEVSMSKLSAGKRRPCCFNLAACTDPDLARNGKLIGI
jgi:hypothetical protein